MLKRWRGFPLQLLVFVIFPLTALLVAIAFGSLALHQRAMRTLVGERDERAARAAATAITEQLNHRAATVHSLALQANATGDPAGTLNDATAFLPDFERGLAFFDANGELLAATNAPDVWQGIRINRRLDESSLAYDPRNEAYFIPAFIDPGSGDEVMLAIAKTPDGVIAAGAFSPANLARRALTDVFGSSDQAAAFLVDSAGQLLFQLGAEPHTGLSPAQYPGVEDALRGDSGATYLSVGGDEHVVAFSPLAQ
jgi:hypothetical protein